VENALAYHAGCSEEDYVHGFMLQRGGCRAEVGAKARTRTYSTAELLRWSTTLYPCGG
jgi:hypothetical protein